MEKSVLLILFIMLFSAVSCGSSATGDSATDDDVFSDESIFYMGRLSTENYDALLIGWQITDGGMLE